MLRHRFDSCPKTSLPFFVLVLGLAQTTSGHATETVTYYYTDGAGNVLATTDAAGNINSSSDYRPFGIRQIGVAVNGPAYAGHYEDMESNLVYMKARYYDPEIGRFLSTDPDDVKPGRVESISKFAYAANNPFKFADDTGKRIVVIENASAPHANSHSIADAIADANTTRAGATVIAQLEASDAVNVITPAGRREGSTTIPTDGSGRLNQDGTKSEGTGTVIKIQMGTEKVNVSNKPGEVGNPEKVSPGEKVVHEGEHGVMFNNGTMPAKSATDPNTGNPAAEQPAMEKENQYRQEKDLDGTRQVY